MGKGKAWPKAELDLLRENLDLPIALLCDKLGKSESAVRNARLRMKKELGLPIRGYTFRDGMINQELWDRPPGLYVETIGRLLYEDEECMAHWIHAHGYSRVEFKYEDSLGWVTLTCLKEK